MNREIGVFVGNHVSSEAQARGFQTLTHAGFSLNRFSRENPIPPYRNFGAVATIGGDGTVQTALSQIHIFKDPPPLILIPAGTNNATHRAAQLIGAGIGTDQMGSWFEDPCQWQPFRPGLVGDETPFSVDAWLGESRRIARYNKELRGNVPTWLRSAFAAARNWHHAATNPEQGVPLLDIYTISSFFGKHQVFPEQNFNGEDITRLHIPPGEQGALGRLLIAYIGLGTGNHRLLERSLSITQAESFEPNYRVKKIGVNGSTREIPERNPVIHRSDKKIPIAAVIYDHRKKSR